MDRPTVLYILYTMVSAQQQTNLLPKNALRNDAIFAQKVYRIYATTSQYLKFLWLRNHHGIYIYIYIYIYMYIHIHMGCIYIYIHIHTYTYTFIAEGWGSVYIIIILVYIYNYIYTVEPVYYPFHMRIKTGLNPG